ncbi:MAG: DUF87 domain-containing protein [Nitrososphaerota archaeon]
MLLRIVATLIVIVVFIGIAYYAASTVQQRLYERGIVGEKPMLDIRALTSQITYWLSIGFAAAFLITIAVVSVKAIISSRRLLRVIPFKDFQKHLLVLGPTGSGKTNTAKQAINMALSKGVEVVVLDWKA